MIVLYTLQYIPKSGEGTMVKCPKCGHNFRIEYKCLRCNYKWVPRNPNKEPKVCPNPKCKSPYWNKPRQNRNSGGTK